MQVFPHRHRRLPLGLRHQQLQQRLKRPFFLFLRREIQWRILRWRRQGEQRGKQGQGLLHIIQGQARSSFSTFSSSVSCRVNSKVRCKTSINGYKALC